MDPQQVVQSITMGSRIAEDERDDLSTYFVETENWRKVYQGEADVIFAPKGGGKSAIYSMLMSRESDFFDRGILLATAENPSGGTAFAEVETDPPTTEAEFIGLWKIYFLSIIAQTPGGVRHQEATRGEVAGEAGRTRSSPAERGSPSPTRPHGDGLREVLLPPAPRSRRSMTVYPATGVPVVRPEDYVRRAHAPRSGRPARSSSTNCSTSPRTALDERRLHHVDPAVPARTSRSPTRPTSRPTPSRACSGCTATSSPEQGRPEDLPAVGHLGGDHEDRLPGG